MRHRKRGRKLNRTSSHRTALGRNLVAALFRHERIVTTEAKAKEYRSMADKLITLGKRGSLHDRRRAVSLLQDQAMVKKLFDDIAPRFKDRPGGYTRILRLQATSDHKRSGLADAKRLRIRRLGDSAPTVYLELVTETLEESQKRNEKRYRGKKRRSSTKKAKAAAVLEEQHTAEDVQTTTDTDAAKAQAETPQDVQDQVADSQEKEQKTADDNSAPESKE